MELQYCQGVLLVVEDHFFSFTSAFCSIFVNFSQVSFT